KKKGYFELLGPAQAEWGSPVCPLLQPSQHEGPADAPAQPSISHQGPSSTAHAPARSPYRARPSSRLNLRSPAPPAQPTPHAKPIRLVLAPAHVAHQGQHLHASTSSPTHAGSSLPTFQTSSYARRLNLPT
ncbi:unnamed protein product, partial [Prunus brigantina]